MLPGPLHPPPRQLELWDLIPLHHHLSLAGSLAGYSCAPTGVLRYQLYHSPSTDRNLTFREVRLLRQGYTAPGSQTQLCLFQQPLTVMPKGDHVGGDPRGPAEEGALWRWLVQQSSFHVYKVGPAFLPTRQADVQIE